MLNDNILDYKRDRALDWLRKKIDESDEPDQLDQELDALIRKVAHLQNGALYGFVKLPENGNANGNQSTVKDSQIKALQNTYIKSKAVAANYLYDNEKIAIKAGMLLDIETVKQDINQHLWIKIPNGKEGLIYGPHWELPTNAKNNEVKLKVPYFSQRDNWDKYHGPGGRQCCLTAHCMAADFLLNREITLKAKDKEYKEPEDLYGEILRKYGDTTEPEAHTPTLQHFGVESYFTRTGSIKDLLLCLDKGVPVPMGVAYKAGGHYICAVGHKSDGVYIHDPFGIRIGMTDNYENASGAYDFVTWDWLQAKWVDQGSEAGWMRVITQVKGKSTDIPGGL
jgi:hypothetical protein